MVCSVRAGWVAWFAVLLTLGGCASSSTSTTETGGTSKVAASNTAATAGAGKSDATSSGAKSSATASGKGATPTKAATPTAAPSRIGDVRISLFAITKGKMSNEYAGNYVMLVNRSWVQHKRSFKEPFWELTRPGIKIVDDDVMEGLLKHLTDSGFYNMPAVANIDVAALKGPQVEGVRYVTVNRDGQSRTVERARVSKSTGLLNKFVDIELGINQVWHSSQTYVTRTERQDWRDAFQGYLEGTGWNAKEGAGTEIPAGSTENK